MSKDELATLIHETKLRFLEYAEVDEEVIDAFGDALLANYPA